MNKKFDPTDLYWRSDMPAKESLETTDKIEKLKIKPFIEANGDKIEEILHCILESHFWLPKLRSMTAYERLHDDHDGTYTGKISVVISDDGDAWLQVIDTEPGFSLRYRMPMIGGGVSPRVRTALVILAEAIRLDNEKIPLDRPPSYKMEDPSEKVVRALNMHDPLTADSDREFIENIAKDIPKP
jgi:hypothetical protein